MELLESWSCRLALGERGTKMWRQHTPAHSRCCSPDENALNCSNDGSRERSVLLAVGAGHYRFRLVISVIISSAVVTVFAFAWNAR